MKITLNIPERLYISDLFTLWKGNVLTEGAQIMECAKSVVLSIEEQTEIEYVQEGQIRKWNVTKAKDKEVELNAETKNYILGKLKERDEAKEATFAEINMVQELRKKLA